jgi:hypothetical protein
MMPSPCPRDVPEMSQNATDRSTMIEIDQETEMKG